MSLHVTALSPLLRPRDASHLSKYNIDPLPDVLKGGLVAIIIVAVLSLIATVSLLAFLTYRMVFWRTNYIRYIGYNQYVVLIYNLLLADMLQSLAFILSVKWVAEKQILATAPACYAQGLLLQIGDPGSGLFVFAISVHTFLLVSMRRKLPYRVFVAIVVGLWAFIILLVILPPALFGRDAFVPSDAWVGFYRSYFQRCKLAISNETCIQCWISEEHKTCRLWLHYIWIFISEFGTVCLYAIAVFQLRQQISKSAILESSQAQNLQRLRRVVGYMVLYPIAYIVLSLPLAAGRMAIMNGRTPSLAYFCVAGAVMTSSGLVDVFLYTLTRRNLLVDSESSDSHSDNRFADTKYGHNIDLSHQTIITAGRNDGARSYFPTGSRLSGGDANASAHAIARDGSMDAIIVGSGQEVVELVPLGKVYQQTTIEVTSEPAYPSDSNSNAGSSLRRGSSGSSSNGRRHGRRWPE